MYWPDRVWYYRAPRGAVLLKTSSSRRRSPKVIWQNRFYHVRVPASWPHPARLRICSKQTNYNKIKHNNLIGMWGVGGRMEWNGGRFSAYRLAIPVRRQISRCVQCPHDSMSVPGSIVPADLDAATWTVPLVSSDPAPVLRPRAFPVCGIR